MSIFGAGLQDTSVPWYGATKKIDYMPISLAGPWGPSGPWHIKKLCHQKKILCRSFFYPQRSLLGNAQRKLIFTSPPNIKKN